MLSSWPSRSTTSVEVAPPDPAIAVRTSSQVGVGTPSQDRTSSPARMPAAAAGAGDVPREVVRVCGTEDNVVEGVPTPMPTSATTISTTQISRFVTGPASMTTILRGAERL